MASRGHRKVITLGLDYSEFKGGITEANRQIRVLDAEFRNASEKTKVFGTNMDQLGLKGEQLSQKVLLQAQKVELLKKKYEENAKSLGDNSKKTDESRIKYKNAETQLERLKSELENVNGKLKDNGTIFDDVAKNIDDFSGRIKDAGADLEELGRGMQTLGMTMTAAITLPLAALGKTSLGAYEDFEYAFAGVRKTVTATEEQFKELEKGIRDMAKDMPTAAEDIAEVAETAGQLGIQTDAILGFSEVMINLGNTTNLSANEAATALAQFANITKMSQEDFDRLGSTIFKLDTSLATTAKSIVDMGLRLAGAGKQVGMSEAEILGFSGALSSVGIEAEAGGSAFSKLMINMQLATEKGGKDLRNFAKVAGMSSAEFKRTFKADAAGAIVAFIEGLGDMQSKGKSTIGTLDEIGITEVRMRDALLRAATAGDLFSDSIAKGTEEWEKNEALTKGAAERYATFTSKMEVFKNNLKDIGITLGASIAPVILDILEILTPFVNILAVVFDIFSKLPEPIRKVVVIAGILLAIIGPILTLLGTLLTKLDSIGGMFKGVSGAVTTFGSVIKGLNSPLLKILAIILSIVAALTVLLTLFAAITGKSGELSKITADIGKVSTSVNNSVNSASKMPSYATVDGSHKSGLDYVPFDGYVAELHRGERVQRAEENPYNPNATSNSSGSGDQYITVNVNASDLQSMADVVKLFNELKQTKRAGVVY
ncbi:phage tail tape measure protein [uncultured Clostridium sp.]|uniref:phage tail tape measure protein n=1 Tax=uncultured Clostridium sp. TaxID=59620 RepID=UPI0028ECCF3B|nr:phage tail tape measure protein [uncultured Clostridium sp.]